MSGLRKGIRAGLFIVGLFATLSAADYVCDLIDELFADEEPEKEEHDA
jgi:hypothetical protein